MQQPKTDWLLSAPVTPTNPKADSPLFPFIARLIRGEDLSAQEAVKFFRILTDMRHGSIQIAAAITALTAKGETAAELAGMASVMREQAIKIVLTNEGVDPTTGASDDQVIRQIVAQVLARSANFRIRRQAIDVARA